MPSIERFTAHRLLYDLHRKKQNAFPSQEELQHLKIDIQHTDRQADTKNSGVINSSMMRVLINFRRIENEAPAKTSQSLASYLIGGIVRPLDYAHYDPYPKVRLGADKLLLKYQRRVKVDHIFTVTPKEADIQRLVHMAVIARTACKPTVSITSEELYTILWLASAQAAKDNSPFDLKVRLVVTYMYQVKILNIRTTQHYIGSIFEGKGEILDQMEIEQTSWFDISQSPRQIYLFALESLELDKPASAQKRDMSHNMEPVQQSAASKRRRYLN